MENKYKIGDTVYIAQAATKQKYITCPHCNGSGKLTCILGDGSEVGFDCSCCEKGWVGSTGTMKVYEYESVAKSVKITGMEIKQYAVRYHSGTECNYTVFNEEDAFETEEEALSHAEIKKAEHEVEEKIRIEQRKENANKSWAWNATYHRNQIKYFEQQLEYHKKKLEVAQSKAR